jgi:hypothetical protein
VRILGIDPGIKGAAALFCGSPATPTVDNGLFDLPTLGEGNQKELDYAEIRNRIWGLKPDVVFIEQVNAFLPRRKNEETGEVEIDPWGATSMFRFAGSYYALRAVVTCLDLPLRTLTPGSWKTGLGLRGKQKGGGTDDSARQMVLQRYPAVAPFLKFKLHQHRAEAFLIAVYGSRKWRREEENGDLDIPE